MLGRFLACLLIFGSAQSAFAGPIQDAVTQAAQALVHARGSTHLNKNAMIASGVAMIRPGAALAVLANTSMEDETVICSADAVLICGYGSGPKKRAVPWGFRLAGAGVGLTAFGANISIQRSSFTVSKTVTF